MTSAPLMQRTLSNDQIAAFYHDIFVEDQTRHFMSLTERLTPAGTVVDMGGGCGFFAQRLRHLAGRQLRVVDMDLTSVEACHKAGLEAQRGDALAPTFTGDEDLVCFNLILHHLVGSSEAETRRLQGQALHAWQGHANGVFVNEYIYESFVGNLSGWLIFQITKSRVLSAVGRIAATVIPSFKANTFGVGVRFRANAEWVRLFEEAGYGVVKSVEGEAERVAPPLRLLLIRHIRRNSFLLMPRTPP